VLSLQLIDDQGQVWDGSSRQLRHAYDSPYSGGEFSDYAVVNLGFIATNVYGQSAQIRLRPSFTADAAYDALYRWVLGRRFDRIVLTWLDDSWQNEMLRSNQAALIRLDDIIEEAKRQRPEEFMSTLIPRDEIMKDATLQELIGKWTASTRDKRPETVGPAINSILGNRYAIVQQDKVNSRLLYKELGDGLFTSYDTWRACAVGAPMEEMPDRAYGRWVKGCYTSALASMEPTIEKVDAIVHWPHSGRTRMRYRRLILPLSLTDGSRIVVGGSLVDDRVDLRFRRREKT
jgi:hypothetical protein